MKAPPTQMPIPKSSIDVVCSAIRIKKFLTAPATFPGKKIEGEFCLQLVDFRTSLAEICAEVGTFRRMTICIAGFGGSNSFNKLFPVIDHPKRKQLTTQPPLKSQPAVESHVCCLTLCVPPLPCKAFVCALSWEVCSSEISTKKHQVQEQKKGSFNHLTSKMPNRSSIWSFGLHYD